MEDGFFIIGVFVFMFILWLATGGPTHPLSFAGPVLHTTISSGGNARYNGSGAFRVSYFPSTNKKQSTPRASNEQIEQKISQVSRQVRELSNGVSNAVLFGTPSPYKGEVFLNHFVWGAGSSNPNREYVVLHVSSDAPHSVDISGWSLESGTTGKKAIIPKGTEVPRSGIINAGAPIIISPGDKAIISSGQSPIGASFEENVCTGYLAQYQSFYPQLPRICPTPESELRKFYRPQPYSRDLACITKVQNIQRCTLVGTIPQGLTTSCSTLLTTYMNYNGCTNAHEHDVGFLGDTWRVYLGRTNNMWRARYETVKLLDAHGKTVDMFSY